LFLKTVKMWKTFSSLVILFLLSSILTRVRLLLRGMAKGSCRIYDYNVFLARIWPNIPSCLLRTEWNTGATFSAGRPPVATTIYLLEKDCLNSDRNVNQCNSWRAIQNENNNIVLSFLLAIETRQPQKWPGTKSKKI